MFKYTFTYKFQEKDIRDYKHTTISHPTNNNLEVTNITQKGISNFKTTKVSPRKFMVSKLPAVLDQGNLGTCVSNAFSFVVSKQTNNNIPLSRLFLYNICRSIDNTPLNQDDGTTIRTACQAIRKYGVCKETIYPYINSNCFVFPTLTAFQRSRRFMKFTYFFITQTLLSIKNSLVTYNSPIIFGILVYSSFMSSTNGIIPYPNTQKEMLLGGHCITIVGYDDSTQLFTCSNSWGTSWGLKGYFTLPYKYVLDPNLASDFCVTTFVY
jgi:C1A family cysteine protease